MPDNVTAIWLSVALGVGFAIGSAAIGGKLEKRNADRVTGKRRANLPWFFHTLPTFVGLLTAAWATFSGGQDGKFAITLILIGGHAVESVAPSVRAAVGRMLDRMKVAFVRALAEALRNLASASSTCPAADLTNALLAVKAEPADDKAGTGPVPATVDHTSVKKPKMTKTESEPELAGRAQ
ncbi:hypothetical protein [Amycolatopsis sp. NBC_00438]|uniref:hypothetical protein n=1 Tax=Amycolatopsis sp. NBC_00438 TaxID=2903558 RepID=UPI002E1C959E